MKKATIIASLFCGAFFLSSCDPQPEDSETVIIEENTTKDPVVVEEENANEERNNNNEDGVDVELGTDEDGKVDVNVKGRVGDDN